MKTLLKNSNYKFKYLFFSSINTLLNVGTPSFVPNKKITRERILNFISENKIKEAQKLTKKIFQKLQKQTQEKVLAVLIKLVPGEKAAEILKLILPDIQKICLEKNEDFVINLINKIRSCLTAEECHEILPNEIQKLFYAEKLSKESILDNEKIYGPSQDRKIIAFYFEKNVVEMINPEEFWHVEPEPLAP